MAWVSRFDLRDLRRSLDAPWAVRPDQPNHSVSCAATASFNATASPPAGWVRSRGEGTRLDTITSRDNGGPFLRYAHTANDTGRCGLPGSTGCMVDGE